MIGVGFRPTPVKSGSPDAVAAITLPWDPKGTGHLASYLNLSIKTRAARLGWESS